MMVNAQNIRHTIRYENTFASRFIFRDGTKPLDTSNVTCTVAIQYNGCSVDRSTQFKTEYVSTFAVLTIRV